ncbi:MAG: hypothetical protein ABR529_06995 [Actinomycetota bacterium]
MRRAPADEDRCRQWQDKVRLRARLFARQTHDPRRALALALAEFGTRRPKGCSDPH